MEAERTEQTGLRASRPAPRRWALAKKDASESNRRLLRIQEIGRVRPTISRGRLLAPPPWRVPRGWLGIPRCRASRWRCRLGHFVRQVRGLTGGSRGDGWHPKVPGARWRRRLGHSVRQVRGARSRAPRGWLGIPRCPDVRWRRRLGHSVRQVREARSRVPRDAGHPKVPGASDARDRAASTRQWIDAIMHLSPLSRRLQKRGSEGCAAAKQRLRRIRGGGATSPDRYTMRLSGRPKPQPQGCRGGGSPEWPFVQTSVVFRRARRTREDLSR